MAFTTFSPLTVIKSAEVNANFANPVSETVTLDGQGSTPTSPSSGFYKVYMKDSTQKLTILDSAGVETTVGSGAGSNNYISATDGTTIGDWATYADAAASSPVDGTGGSASSTFAVSTSSTLRGTTNFLWTHSAANRQGEGFSYLMAIDPSDRGKVLRLSFDYLIASGTYADDDLQIWFYDATNAALIQGAPYKIKNSGIIERFNSEVQVPSSCASLRVIFHVATSTATAYTIRFDDFIFAQQAKLYGSAVTDWVNYTPTGTWVSNATYSGKWRRVGDSIEVEVLVTCSGAPTSATLTVTLPSGLSVDTAKITDLDRVGVSYAEDAGVTGYEGIVRVTGNSIRPSVFDSSSTYGSTASVTQAVPFTFGNTDFVKMKVMGIPIVGWSSSQVMSSDAATQVIAMTATGSGTALTKDVAATVVWTTTTRNDGGGTFDGTTYTISTPGWYVISAALRLDATYTTTQYNFLEIRRNGASIRTILRAPITATGIDIIEVEKQYYFEAGNTITIVVTCGGVTPSISAQAIYSHFNVKRISGPAQIATSETVAMHTDTSTTTISGSVTTLLFINTVFDTHGAYASGTGLYTAPVSGIYKVEGTVYCDITDAVNKIWQVYIYRDSTNMIENVYRDYSATNTDAVSFPISGLIKVLAGQTISIRASTDGSSPTLTSSRSRFEVLRVGNY